MNTTTANRLKKLAAVSILSVASSAALAGPLFSSLEYAITSGFTGFAPASVVGTQNVPLAAGGTGSQLLSWGTPTGVVGPVQSQVGVVDFLPGTVMINGPAVTTGFVFHNNAPINGDTLDTAVLTTDLVLALDFNNAASIFPPQRIDINVDFDETNNRVACELGGTPIPQGGFGCDDIFTLDLVGAGFNSAGQIIQPLPLPDPDYLYLAVLTVQDVQQLTDAECGVAEAPLGCFGLITGERLVTQEFVTLQIIAQKIPAPATLGLLGLGLLGFGARGMRRRAS